MISHRKVYDLVNELYRERGCKATPGDELFMFDL